MFYFTLNLNIEINMAINVILNKNTKLILSVKLSDM